MSPRTAKGLGLGVLLLGFAFLYLPILLLMFYSFNSSRLAMVWAGFSTRAYSDLFADRALMDAMWTSLVVAFWTACTATVLGTLAAMVMTRFEKPPPAALRTARCEDLTGQTSCMPGDARFPDSNRYGTQPPKSSR